MLNLLDQLIERVLDSTGWTPVPPPPKPGFYFTVPDEDWLARVHSGNNVRLNIYIVRDAREPRHAPRRLGRDRAARPHAISVARAGLLRLPLSAVGLESREDYRRRPARS